MNTEVSVMFYNGKGLFDRTREYQITDAVNRWYWEMLSNLIMGWRLEGNLTSGDVPFYTLPYITSAEYRSIGIKAVMFCKPSWKLCIKSLTVGPSFLLSELVQRQMR